MAFLRDAAFDAALANITAAATRLDICSSEPSTYAQATSSLSLGNATSISLTGPADASGGGRELSVDAIASQSVTATGTAAFWALTDGDSVLLATGGISPVTAVTSGNTWSLTGGTAKIIVRDAI